MSIGNATAAQRELDGGTDGKGTVTPQEYPARGAGVKLADLNNPSGPHIVETAWSLAGVNQVRVRFRDGFTVDIDGWRMRQVAEEARR